MKRCLAVFPWTALHHHPTPQINKDNTHSKLSKSPEDFEIHMAFFVGGGWCSPTEFFPAPSGDVSSIPAE
eukprot:5622071-Amphidinium_carterae.1